MRQRRRRLDPRKWAADIPGIDPREIAWRKPDIEAYDKLGPMTKALLDASPINITVKTFLDDFRHRGRPMVDPDSPSYKPATPESNDLDMADFLLKAIRSRVPKFEPIQGNTHGRPTSPGDDASPRRQGSGSSLRSVGAAGQSKRS